jgi:hypothetical protein
MNEFPNIGFRPNDYEVVSAARRIIHLTSGSAFKFATGRRLALIKSVSWTSGRKIGRPAYLGSLASRFNLLGTDLFYSVS